MDLPKPTGTPNDEVHVWAVRLDADGWPLADGLPAEERERAGRVRRENARRRWVASRWALREVLGRYLGCEPAAVRLRLGEHGKPLLADPAASLRFNLSHSAELALVAIADGREVGVDVQELGERPAGFYAEWARREAIAKCHGTGLWAEPPGMPVVAEPLEAPAGYAACLAVAGRTVPAVRRFELEPARC